MSTKFSRKTFLKGSVAGLGMMALNVCTAGAASAAEPAAAAAEDTNSLNLVPKKAASVKVTSRGSVSGGWRAGVPQLEGSGRYAGHEPHVHLCGLRRAGNAVRGARVGRDRL